MNRIPFCDLRPAHRPIESEMMAAIFGCLERSSFLRGQETKAFEEEWAAFSGQRYAVCCNSGTDALTLAAIAMDLKTATIPATTLPLTGIGLHLGGAKVRLEDVDEDGRMLDAPDDAVPVLLYGRPPVPVELDARLFDAAHAHGWQPPQQSTACWSFYPTKSLGTLGDGGAITTNDEGLAQLMTDLCGRSDVMHDRRQITSRMDEIQAAVLRVKLRHLPQWLEERKAIAQMYDDRFRKWGITLGGPSLHHLYVVRTNERDELAHHLRAENVEVKMHWETPLHKQDGPWKSSDMLPNAQKWCDSVLSLPCYPGLTHEQVGRVATAVDAFHERRRQERDGLEAAT